MKKNYLLITLALTLIVNATSVNAADFLVRKNVTSNSSVASPTEAFYTHLTSLPYQPVDSVDMSNSTLAPTTYFSCFGSSYPTKGYKVILATPGTITLYAMSTKINIGNTAFVITSHYDLSDYVYVTSATGTSGTLSAGTYYIALVTNNLYGKYKLSITSTATITTELGNTENNQIQLYSANNSIIAKGVTPQSVIKVYNISGQLIKSVLASSQNEEIPMPNKGIYIVKVNGMSKKITIL